MATVFYWRTFWVDAGETGLLPGQEHHWAMWGFGFLDVLAGFTLPFATWGRSALSVRLELFVCFTLKEDDHETLCPPRCRWKHSLAHMV